MCFLNEFNVEIQYNISFLRYFAFALLCVLGWGKFNVISLMIQIKITIRQNIFFCRLCARAFADCTVTLKSCAINERN